MIQFIFITLLLISSTLFLMMNHPLSMGIMLMTQTLLITILSGLITKSFWFSYSLFLIFLGGMLIILMYMTSIASNEIFSFHLSKKLLLSTFLLFMLLMTLIIMNNDLKLMFFNKIFNLETQSMMNMKNLMIENNFSLNKLYNFPTNSLTLLLINYLFLTLIMVVKITNIFMGPLRSKY